MSVHTRRTSSAVALAVFATLVLAANALAAAPTWTIPKTLRTASDIQLHDADFSVHNVAVAWDEPDSPRKVGIRTSVDNGSHFGPISWFAHARQPAVDICGGSELNAVLALEVAPGNFAIEHEVGSIDGTGFLSTPVAPGGGVQRYPDVACAGGRVFVSWLHRESGGDRLFVAHALRTGGGFSSPLDLGFDGRTFYGHSLALAGVSNMAYGAFARTGGDLRLMRWSIGPGPGFVPTSLGEQVIAPGTPSDPADDVVIAAAGTKVAVAWFRCNAVLARVSNDSGQTWGPIRTLVETASCDGDFIAAQEGIAIKGNRIAITYAGAGFFSSFVGLIRTTNDFASFTDDTIASNYQVEHFVGYLTVGGTTRLAAAFQKGHSVKFRRQT